MSDARKRWLLFALVAVAVAGMAYVGWRMVVLTSDESSLFAASVLCAPLIALAGAFGTEWVIDWLPARLLPVRWTPARPAILQGAAVAIIAAVVLDTSPALWLAIVASAAGACWAMSLHDTATDRAASDAQFRAERG